jgi:acyl-CoA reductase-like NAD-dependent aldehyde dehydrogenase
MLKEVLNLELDSPFGETFDLKDEVKEFKIYIGGRWRASEKNDVFDIRTPIDGSLIARSQKATPGDVSLATTAAKEMRGIRELPAIERIEIFNCAAGMLETHKDELARTLQLEAGKTNKDAIGEVNATIHRLKLTLEEARRIFGEYLPGDWSSGMVGKMALVIREPVGVVAAITSFNYPLFIAATKVVPALLAGNSVVLKPSSSNPLSATMLVKILEISGVPAGSLNLITGKGEEAGDALIADQNVNMVNFTGSTPVGRRVSQMAVMKKLHLELGGKAYALILEDADLDLAAERCVFGSLKFAGQRCDAVSAVIAVEPVADALSEKIVREIDNWKFGDPRDESVTVGPVINQSAAQRIHGMVMDAVDKGAELLRGGRFQGSYYEPTVLDDVPIYATIAREETFGPVIPIIRMRDEKDALAFAKASNYGLESCVFTKDFYRMWHFAKALECGEVTINDCPQHGVGYFPFGGIKDSGMGREGIGYSIDEMTNLKTIVFNLEAGGLGKKELSAATCRTMITPKHYEPADGE